MPSRSLVSLLLALPIHGRVFDVDGELLSEQRADPHESSPDRNRTDLQTVRQLTRRLSTEDAQGDLSEGRLEDVQAGTMNRHCHILKLEAIVCI